MAISVRTPIPATIEPHSADTDVRTAPNANNELLTEEGIFVLLDLRDAMRINEDAAARSF